MKQLYSGDHNQQNNFQILKRWFGAGLAAEPCMQFNINYPKFNKDATLRPAPWPLAILGCMCRVLGELVLCRLCPKAKPLRSPSAVHNSQNPSLSSAGCNGIPLSEVQIQLLLRFNKLDFLHCFRDASLQSTVGQQCHDQFIDFGVCVCVCVSPWFCLSTLLFFIAHLTRSFWFYILLQNK